LEDDRIFASMKCDAKVMKGDSIGPGTVMASWVQEQYELEAIPGPKIMNNWKPALLVCIRVDG